MKCSFVFLAWLVVALPAYSQGRLMEPTPHPLLNKPLPSFQGKTLDGKDVTLESYRGKYIVLDMWSFTCGACYKEIPELNAIAGRYADRNVVVLSLLAESREEALTRIQEGGKKYQLKKPAFFNKEIEYEIIPDSKKTIESYTNNLRGYPFLLFIDDKGIVRGFIHGYELSYGNPPADQTDNFKEIKETLDEILSKK